MRKGTLVFDMDGTIADLYGVNGWLKDLRSENTRPYEIAKPIYDMDTLNFVLNILKSMGYRVAITTWLAKNGSEDYNERTTKAKIDWLDRYGFPYDEINAVPYGYEKSLCTKRENDFQILFDDSEEVRKTWVNGITVNANDNILDFLTKLIMD